jgi:hypothetical protein
MIAPKIKQVPPIIAGISQKGFFFFFDFFFFDFGFVLSSGFLARASKVLPPVTFFANTGSAILFPDRGVSSVVDFFKSDEAISATTNSSLLTWSFATDFSGGLGIESSFATGEDFALDAEVPCSV